MESIENKILRQFAENDYSQHTTDMMHEWMLEKEASCGSAMREIWDDMDSSGQKGTGRMIFWKVAASLLLVVSLASTYFAFVRNDVQADLAECYCPVAEMKSLVLPDGTNVTLNAGTVLLYPERFNGKTRSVYLSGEAYFDVAKDREHPFIVKVNDFQVTALGTEFNVNAYPDASCVSATLVEGSVKVEYDNLSSSAVLSPDQQFVYDRVSKSADLRTPDVYDVIAWRTGELVFSNSTLDQIFDSMELRFGYEIISVPDLCGETFSFRFRDGLTFSEVLDIIAQVSGSISYRIDGTKCYITNK